MIRAITRRLRRPRKVVTSPLHRELTVEEKKSLRQWFTLPETQLAMQVVAAYRPNLLTNYDHPDPAMLQFRDSTRINHARGWDECYLRLQWVGSLLEEARPAEFKEWEQPDER